MTHSTLRFDVEQRRRAKSPDNRKIDGPVSLEQAVRVLQSRRVKYRTDKTRQAMDDLAEAMANGASSISAAARELRLTQSRADQLWQMIRRELGPQAV